MELQTFQTWIVNGLGRTVLFLREHPWEPYADAIEHVCRHNTAYDPQCEGTRAEYVYKIVKLTGAAERFGRVVVSALREPQGTDWDTVHQFHLARLFAQDGFEPVRAAMYDGFERNDSEYHRFVGDDEIVALDGLSGLLFVIDRMGRYLAEQPESAVDDVLLSEAEAQLGADAVSLAIRRQAEVNRNVSRYAEAVERYRLRDVRKRDTSFNGLPWPAARERIRKGGVNRPWLFGWGRSAGEDDLRQAAVELLGERDDRLILSYLRLFHRQPFPLAPSRLIELARSDDREIRLAAMRALRNVAAESVRAFAIEQLSKGRDPDEAVGLLVKNFRRGDERTIEALLDRAADDDAFHSIAFAARSVFENYPASDAAASLLTVYERGRCGLCRGRAVQLLVERRELPAHLIDECRHDASENTRQAVGGMR